MRHLSKDNKFMFSDARTKLYLLASFVFPVLLLLVFAYKFKIYPFSEKCFVSDYLQNTYFPVITELRRKVAAHESLFYTWNLGGGSDFWSLFLYYAASPFTLIYILFPKLPIQKASQIIFALKAATASLAFSILLWKKENIVSPVGTALSVAYGLSAYVLTFSQEPSLLDTVILAPILILTLSDLIREKHSWSFAIVFALTAMTSFMGGSIMLFTVFVFFPLLLIEAKAEDGYKRRFWAAFTDFGRNLMFGLGISSVIWFPLLKVLSHSELAQQTLKIPGDLGMQLKVWDILERLCFDAFAVLPSDEVQYPSVYCGILCVILIILYGFSKKISFAEKVYSYCALLLIYLTMASKVLAFIMHGLHFPIAGIYPQALPLLFLIMYMGGRLLSTGMIFEERLHLQVAVILPCIFLLINCAISTEINYNNYSVYVAVGLIIFYYALLARISQKEKRGTAFWTTMLAAIMIVETGLSFYRPIKEKYYSLAMKNFVKNEFALSKQVGDAAMRNITDKDKKEEMVYELDSKVIYQEPEIQTKKLMGEVKALIPQGGRAICDFEEMQNAGLLYDFPTIGSAYPFARHTYVNLLNTLGMRSGKNDNLNVFSSNPVTDILMNIRVKISNDYGDIYKKESEAAGALGYFSSSTLLNERFPEKMSWYEAQNHMAYEITGIEPFSGVPYTLKESSHISEKDGVYSITSDDPGAEVLFELEKPYNYPIYIYCDASQSFVVEVRDLNSNGLERGSRRYSQASGEYIVIEASELVEDWDTIEVRIVFTQPKKEKFHFAAATLDEELLRQFQTEIERRGIILTSLGTDKVEGKVTADGSGSVIFSIPYDSGWTAYIDGAETRSFVANGALLGIRSPEGEHTFELRYVPTGLSVCAWVSGISIVLMILCAIAPLFSKKHVMEEDGQDEEQLIENEEEISG